MPPICTHLSIAGEAILRLRHPVVNANKGCYYLGSTAPDMRFVIGASREETHFLSLECAEGTSGVKPMFQAHPELMKDAGLSAATKSFIAGYFSHLVTDEAWIYSIYRPFFGKSSSLRGNAMANLLDRVLQFELDRREKLNNESMLAIRAELNAAASGVCVNFIDSSSLKRWHDFVSMATTVRASWENLRYFAEKYLTWTRQFAPGELEDFFACFDDRVEQVLQMVPEKRLEAFREQSIADSVTAAREYLG